MAHPWFLLGVLAGLTGVFVHGYLGHRALYAPLGLDRLFATSAFGEVEMTRRIMLVGWHLITAFFGLSGVAFFLLALGRIQDPWLPRFLGAVHLSFLLVACGIVRERTLRTFTRPIPIAFGTVMLTACLVGFLG